MSSLPPWRPCPVNGRVSLLLPPTPPEAGGPGAAADAEVLQSAFTRRPLQGEAASTSSSQPTAAAGGQPETFSFVVSSHRQALRLLLSHRGRPNQQAHPMGFDRPLGSLELPLESLLPPETAEPEEQGAISPDHLSDALEMARNILQAAADAAQPGGSLHGATLAASAAAESAVAAASAAKQSMGQAQQCGPASSSASGSNPSGALPAAVSGAAPADAPALLPLEWEETVVVVPTTDKSSMAELLKDLDGRVPAGSAGEHLA